MLTCVELRWGVPLYGIANRCNNGSMCRIVMGCNNANTLLADPEALL